MKSHWLDRALFINSSHYTLCTTEKQFRQALKHFRVAKKDWPPFVSDSFCNATTHFFENEAHQKKASIVCIADCSDKTPAQIAGLLCHEAVHIWQKTRADLGETAPSAELEAYAIQSLTQSLIEEFERQTK